MPRRLWIVFVPALLAFVGCAPDLESKSKTAAPVSTAPAVASKGVEMDENGFPKLPPGAGAIDPDALQEFETTASGLKYRILRKSDGRHPTSNDNVLAHYVGWLDGGEEFDSSYRRGQPIGFALTKVVRGWTEGIPLVGEGGMIELEIPSNLGYGPDGMPPVIPGNATLHFVVELQKIR
ncbi:MAG: FKBP-type peptidyl-prolyl cis-trans isomerase [Planctomycetaceae bacterium]